MAQYWKPRGRVDLIPLIDVMVNLLFFFLLFGSFDNGAAALKVNPPVSSTAAAVQTERVVITLDAQGQYAIDGQTVPASELPARVTVILEKNPGTQVVLYPDESVSYQDVVTALDLLRNGGVERPALGVRRGDSPSEKRGGGNDH